MSSPTRWLTRYLDGDRAEVWRDMRHVGGRVRESPFCDEAQAVCDEMARRARHNIEVLVGRLLDQGYRFHENDDDATPVEPLAGPAPDAEELVAWLDRTFGPIPMVLSSWVRIVGDVWMVGTHPDWSASAAADPLVVEVAGCRHPANDIRPFLLDEFQAWQEYSDGEPFQLPVAPDQLHKNNVSGGSPYGIVLPDAGVDALIVTDTEMSFVSYLRTAFDAGGFPGATDRDRQWIAARGLASGLKAI